MTLTPETPKSAKVREDGRSFLAKPLPRNASPISTLIEFDKVPRMPKLFKSREMPNQRAQRILQAPVPSKPLHVPDDAHRVTHQRVGSLVACKAQITEDIALAARACRAA